MKPSEAFRTAIATALVPAVHAAAPGIGQGVILGAGVDRFMEC